MVSNTLALRGRTRHQDLAENTALVALCLADLGSKWEMLNFSHMGR